jgi:hypothetical protein
MLRTIFLVGLPIYLRAFPIVIAAHISVPAFRESDNHERDAGKEGKKERGREDTRHLLPNPSI